MSTLFRKEVTRAPQLAPINLPALPLPALCAVALIIFLGSLLLFVPIKQIQTHNGLVVYYPTPKPVVTQNAGLMQPVVELNQYVRPGETIGVVVANTNQERIEFLSRVVSTQRDILQANTLAHKNRLEGHRKQLIGLEEMHPILESYYILSQNEVLREQSNLMLVNQLIKEGAATSKIASEAESLVESARANCYKSQAQFLELKHKIEMTKHQLQLASDESNITNINLESKLNEAIDALSQAQKSTVQSPVSGKITFINSSIVSSGEPVALIAVDDSKLQARLRVEDISEISVGTEATVTHLNEHYKAKVAAIEPTIDNCWHVYICLDDYLLQNTPVQVALVTNKKNLLQQWLNI